MSLTPLHIAAGYSFRKHMAFAEFAAVNILIDSEVLVHMLAPDWYKPERVHAGFHTLWGALFCAFVVWLWRRNKAGAIGAVAGAVSHVLIDAIYHSDVVPFPPMAANPLHGLISQGAMDLLLLGVFIIPIGWECFKRGRPQNAN